MVFFAVLLQVTNVISNQADFVELGSKRQWKSMLEIHVRILSFISKDNKMVSYSEITCAFVIDIKGIC